MRSIMIALLSFLTLLPLCAQDAEAQKRFAGTWEAKWKDKVICTLRLKAGVQISGETAACSIQVDANGDLQDPASDEYPDQPSPILNAKLLGDTLTFDTATRMLTWTVNYRGLSSPANAAHIHGPGGPGVVAPVLVRIRSR